MSSQSLDLTGHKSCAYIYHQKLPLVRAAKRIHVAGNRDELHDGQGLGAYNLANQLLSGVCAGASLSLGLPPLGWIGA